MMRTHLSQLIIAASFLASCLAYNAPTEHESTSLFSRAYRVSFLIIVDTRYPISETNKSMSSMILRHRKR